MTAMVALRTAAFLLAASTLIAAESSPNASPFLPPAGESAPAQTSPSAYTLAGMTVVSGETLLSITRESDKRSTWISIGKSVGNITAVSFDPKKDEAVIRAEGRELTLTMRKASIRPAPAQPVAPVVAAPLPATNTAASTPPPEPVKIPALNQQEEKEMEARMLVSDLLEIGQQQRRAYEAAQREAAAKAAADSRAKATK